MGFSRVVLNAVKCEMVLGYQGFHLMALVPAFVGLTCCYQNGLGTSLMCVSCWLSNLSAHQNHPGGWFTHGLAPLSNSFFLFSTSEVSPPNFVLLRSSQMLWMLDHTLRTTVLTSKILTIRHHFVLQWFQHQF